MNVFRPLGLSLVIATSMMTGCQHPPLPMPASVRSQAPETFGSLEVNDPRFFALIEVTAPLEKLASGFDWAEGPVWVPSGKPTGRYGPADWRKGGYLLFSDIPPNTIYRWQQDEGISVFLRPSGYTGTAPREGEPGSNGLTLDSEGRLVLCEHGDRRIGRLEKNGKHTTLANRYQGKRLNSPNDLVYKSNGDLYFTDPPYGLEKNMDDPAKELPFQGVYRLRPNGELTLLTDKMSRPNGIGFSPDEKTLYVANSDPKRAVWMAYDVKPDGTLSEGRVLLDVTSLVSAGKKGLPDGLKIDQSGHLFATGPGGVLVITPKGEHLGTINTGEATANCAWGENGSVLYITADMYLCRIKTKTKGKGF